MESVDGRRGFVAYGIGGSLSPAPVLLRRLTSKQALADGGRQPGQVKHWGVSEGERDQASPY